MSPRRSAGGPSSGYANCSTLYRVPSFSKVVVMTGSPFSIRCPFQLLGDPFVQVAEVEPEMESFGISIVVPDTRAAVDAELGDGAVPSETNDVAGSGLVRIVYDGLPCPPKGSCNARRSLPVRRERDPACGGRRRLRVVFGVAQSWSGCLAAL